ncbi:hypothetical protein F511_26155 [Dorcoceras hygrometricum]|uniref:Uncharacterized protein n=1 Tax=Dorcoceras hygrometricum TaxID=472368 RepID=A0A2Z7AMX9_9LAMI|nr:hypothetical protein F511_26155 [Dorcoceras hygrometricum]
MPGLIILKEIGVEEVNMEKIKLASVYWLSTVLGPRRKTKKEEEAVFGLRKDLEGNFEDFKKLVKKRKRDPVFSGFGSFHINGFVQTLQILAYEVFNGVAEAFATRRENADVSVSRMCIG